MEKNSFLFKCYYECDIKGRCALQRILINGICRRPSTPQSLGKLMPKFEYTALLYVAPERGRKPTSVQIKDVDELAVKDAIIESTI